MEVDSTNALIPEENFGVQAYSDPLPGGKQLPWASISNSLPQAWEGGSSGCYGPRAKAKPVRVTQQLTGTPEDFVQKFIKFKSPLKQLNFFFFFFFFTKVGLLEISVGSLGFSNLGPPIANVNSEAENLNLTVL